jgi:hypothetical protein
MYEPGDCVIHDWKGCGTVKYRVPEVRVESYIIAWDSGEMSLASVFALWPASPRKERRQP